MSRVDGERQSTREAERAQQTADKKAREAKLQTADRQTFGKMLKTQEGAKEASRQANTQQQAGQQGETQKQQTQANKGQQARSAMLSRGGVMHQSKVQEQAQGFQGALQQTTQKTGQQDAGRVERRDAGKVKDKTEGEERVDTLQQKAETRKEMEMEQQAVEAHDAARPNAAIGGSGQKNSGSDSQPQDDGGAAALAAAKGKAPTAAEGAKAPQAVKQIPPELLEKLVSTVHLAVNDKGLKEFQIELKDGPLKGGFLKISADGGKVALSFSGIDAQTKNLIEASKGDLMRRLGKKGLALSKLEVN